VSAAITGNRPVEDFELAPLIAVGAMLVGVALLGLLAPRALAWPIAILAGWTATTMVVEAWAVWRKSRQTRAPDRERRDPEPSTRHPEPEPRTEHPEP
jgi:hypothetical protein